MTQSSSASRQCICVGAPGPQPCGPDCRYPYPDSRLGLGPYYRPHIWNRRETYPADAVYVGRPSKWGNLFRVGKDGSRKQVIDLYRRWINEGRPEMGRPDPSELRGKDLVCWCFPLPCHGDVLLELANA